jgi:hypothetical protein
MVKKTLFCKHYDVYKTYQKILIWNWNLQKFENCRKRNFALFLKMVTFTKTAIKLTVLKKFSLIFLAKYEQNGRANKM